MIDLITRVRTPVLYDRMLASAKRTAYGPVYADFELDQEHLPKLAGTYNRLAEKSEADILCFVHDDIEFLSDGWNDGIEELFDEYDADIIGVVGTSKYEGGRIFDAGNAYGMGHFCCEVKGVPYVKAMSKSFRYRTAKVIDGMIMFCRKSFWEKERFDETFDELFFYDTDFCLRGKVGVTCNIFVKHSKPKDLYGKYPDDLKPIGFYEPHFNAKHGFKASKILEAPVCAMTPLESFLKTGQNDLYQWFTEKYATAHS